MAYTSHRGASLPPSAIPSSSLPSSSSTSSSYPGFNGGSSSAYNAGHGHASRPSMADRSFTSFAGSSSSSSYALASSSAPGPSIGNAGIDLPVAAFNSAANRSANAASGLYQTCIALLKRLRRVPGFAERYLDIPDTSASFDSDASSLASPLSPTTPSTSSAMPATALPTDINDPVSQICKSLRLGASLCYIFNMINPEKRLDVNPDANLANFKACQRAAAHFVMACSTQLGWNDEDMFRVGELYSPDTNGTVKVVHTVSKFINLLEERGILLPPLEDEEEDNTNQAIRNAASKSLDQRGKVVEELLMTERKYVQDLEVLQEYARRISEEQLLSQDTIHGLFLNLNSIVDFARRFLIGVETNACLPGELQRFGSLFLLMEESFRVYEPYCVNYPAAAELLQSTAKTDGHILARVAHILDPTELLMFHIKPVQRLLKYHLLFDTLAKATDPSWPYYQELVEGVETAKRIADKINEEKRKQENKQATEELRGLVEDWKGHELSSFGELLLHETFQVLKSEVEREYHVYLFQKIILCCKDAPVPGGKSKVNKSNSMIRKSGTSTPTAAQQKKKQSLQLKGRIFINNVISATPTTKPGSYLLQIKWRGDQLDEAFSIKCRTPDQLTQWHKAVSKAVEEMAAQRRSRSQGQLRRLASPHSQFPNTPQSELGPIVPGFGGSSASLNSVMGYGQNPYGGTFEDEGDENGYHGDYEPSTGRSTPSFGQQRRGVATQSLPPGARHSNGEAIAMGSSRPRAQTEDSNSAVINQWRSQTPGGGYPSVPALPRQSSGASSAASGSPLDGPPSLRHSASKSALRKKQSHEWSNPAPSAAGSSASSTATYTPAMNGARGQSIAQQMDEMSLHGNEPLRMLRQNSQGNMPIHNAPPPLRSRSASSPHVYQLPPGQVQAAQNDKQWSPYPMENVHPAHFAAAQAGRQMSNGQGAMPLKRGMAGNSSTATIASTAGSATTAPPKRFSSSSTGTDRSSEDSSQSQSLPCTSPTSSIATNPNGAMGHYSRESQSTPQPSLPQSMPQSPSSAIKVKVNYGEDTFVIVVLSSITYQELSKKVLHKIHLCGARTNGLDSNTLRLKYEDEEGDKILMTADDDVAMAFDWLRSGGSPNNSLIVFAE